MLTETSAHKRFAWFFLTMVSIVHLHMSGHIVFPYGTHFIAQSWPQLKIRVLIFLSPHYEGCCWRCNSFCPLYFRLQKGDLRVIVGSSLNCMLGNKSKTVFVESGQNGPVFRKNGNGLSCIAWSHRLVLHRCMWSICIYGRRLQPLFRDKSRAPSAGHLHPHGQRASISQHWSATDRHSKFACWLIGFSMKTQMPGLWCVAILMPPSEKCRRRLSQLAWKTPATESWHRGPWFTSNEASPDHSVSRSCIMVRDWCSITSSYLTHYYQFTDPSKFKTN